MKRYDIHFNDNGTVSIETITVLEEGILPGCSLPTLKIRYGDGRVARCGVDMYHPDLESALVEARAEIKSAAESIERQRVALKVEEDRLAKWGDALDKLSTQKEK